MLEIWAHLVEKLEQRFWGGGGEQSFLAAIPRILLAKISHTVHQNDLPVDVRRVDMWVKCRSIRHNFMEDPSIIIGSLHNC